MYKRQRLHISKKAHLILPTHRILDAAYEAAKGDAKVATTGKGIGPTYTDKVSRNGVRVDVYKRQSYFLIETFYAFRKVIMNNPAYIGFINSHPESNSGAHHLYTCLLYTSRCV